MRPTEVHNKDLGKTLKVVRAPGLEVKAMSLEAQAESRSMLDAEEILSWRVPARENDDGVIRLSSKNGAETPWGARADVTADIPFLKSQSVVGKAAANMRKLFDSFVNDHFNKQSDDTSTSSREGGFGELSDSSSTDRLTLSSHHRGARKYESLSTRAHTYPVGGWLNGNKARIEAINDVELYSDDYVEFYVGEVCRSRGFVLSRKSDAMGSVNERHLWGKLPSYS